MIHISRNTIERCHMATIMLYLPHGKGRRAYANARRGTTPTLESAWVEYDTAQTARTPVSLCSEVGTGRAVHHVGSELANRDTRGSSTEARNRLWSIDALPVAATKSILSVSQAVRIDFADCRYLFAIIPDSEGYMQTGRARRGFAMKHMLLVLAIEYYFRTLACNALLDRHYAMWQEARK